MIILEILAYIWIGSVVFLGLLLLWYKIKGIPISEEYDGDDF